LNFFGSRISFGRSSVDDLGDGSSGVLLSFSYGNDFRGSDVDGRNLSGSLVGDGSGVKRSFELRSRGRSRRFRFLLSRSFDCDTSKRKRSASARGNKRQSK
jgi:hypothetical protein